MRRHLRRNHSISGFFILLFLIFATLGGISFAATTTMTFDQFPDGTVLTSQYQNLGVTISGGTVFASCPTCPFPPVSGTNIAYAPTGLMTLSFDPTVIGANVQTVSAYVTDPNRPAGIYAYDSSNNLLGSAVLPAGGGVNVLLTVTSSTTAIAYVTIHDGGGSFSIDNFSFTASATPPPVSFQAAVPYPVSAPPNPTLPYSVAIADFNSDGKVDLAVSDGQSGNGSIDLLFGNGDGTFGAASSANIGTALASYFLTTVDLNSDGKPDLIVADENSNTIGVLLANPSVNGTFLPVVNYAVVGNPISIAVKDFNGDGKLDLAVVNETGASVSILLGNGDGTFGTQVPYPVGNAPNSVAAGDFNGDGKIDLAVVNTNDNTFSILLGNGDGTFQAQTTYSLAPAGTPLSPYSIATYDFNGDGKLDLAITNYFGDTVSVLLGNGNGTFQAAVNYGVGMTPYIVAAGDVNGDNRPDLVVANYGSNTVSVLLGNGDGSFQAAQSFAVGSNPTSVTIADVNGDGKLDLVVPNSNSSNVSVLLNTTPSTVSTSTSTTLTSSLNPSVFGQSVTLTATVTASSGTPTGSVTFNDGTTALGTVALAANGQAAFSTSSFTAGPHSITAVYTPTGSFTGSTSTALLQTVNQATSVIIWATPAAITYGTALSATQLNATANVAGTFTYNPLAGTVLVAGSATLFATFVPTDRTDYTLASASATLTVNQASSTVSLAANGNPSVSFQPVTLIATITPQNGGTSTGTVTFMDGATALATVPEGANIASTTVTSFGPGTHSLSAVYGGDRNVTGNTSAALSQVVNKATTTTALASSANPSYVNQTVTYTATITGQFPGPATGNVTFRHGVTTMGTVPLANNIASISTTYTTTGSHNITAVYSGDANLSASTSGTLTQVVAKFPTTTVVATSGTPSFVGQAVTFTATVSSPNGVPADGETVTFRNLGTVIGTGTTTGGVATFTTSSLPAGNHTITARYVGGTTFAASTSAAILQVVNKYTTSTAVMSSMNPSSYGQPVTYTAAVTSPGPFAVTGTVAFKSGNTTLATVTLSGGSASYTTSTLTAGTKSITAVYRGDGNNASSTSTILSQIVNMAATATSLTSAPNPSTFGSTVTLTATVTSSGGTPGGAVIFRRDATVIGKAALNASGVATITTSTLPRGNISLTGTYIGNANFAGSVGATSQTVN